MSQLTLPTDRIAIGAVRQLEGDLFGERWCGLERSDVSTAIMQELRIAHLAFAQASGHASHEPRRGQREALVQFLNQVYVRYGLSSGRYDTEELVRGIELQARSLAGDRLVR